MDTDYNKNLAFLQKVDRDFPIPLSSKQNLQEYAQKITEYATICAIEDDGNIIAAAIGYTEHLPEKMAYLAVVATVPDYRGRGLAAKCVKQFITQCQSKQIPAVHLYTAVDNIRAIHMYESMGFRKYFPENEPRPDDLHLICCVT